MFKQIVMIVVFILVFTAIRMNMTDNILTVIAVEPFFGGVRVNDAVGVAFVVILDLLRKYPEDLQFPNEIRKPNPKKQQGIQTAHRCNARPFS